MSQSDKIISTTSMYNDVLANVTQMHSNGFLGETEGTRYEAGAEVTVLDRSVRRLRELSALFGPTLKTAFSTDHVIESLVLRADLVIGAVLIAGAAAPKLVSRETVAKMKAGS